MTTDVLKAKLKMTVGLIQIFYGSHPIVLYSMLKQFIQTQRIYKH